MGKKRTTQTNEERQARAAALQASIVEQVNQLRRSDQWRRFLTFAQAFHQYSLNNVLLILAQRPDATQVAGYRTWQSLGRQVRAGEKSIHIFGYRTQTLPTHPEEDRSTTPSEDEHEAATPRTITRYPILNVFDITQTDPVDPDAPPVDVATRLDGADDLGIFTALHTYLIGQG